MPQSVLLFPHTVPRRAAVNALTTWFDSLAALKPPLAASAGPEPYADLEAAGLLRSLVPPAAQGQGLAVHLAEWETWVRQHQGGMAEAVKAGVKPPPPPETVRSVMSEIKTADQPQAPAQEPPPEVRADLFLNLSHQRDMKAVEMESLMAQVDAGQDALDQVMGLEENDAPRADYARSFADMLPPVDYDLPEDFRLAGRLAAWAACASRVDWEGARLAASSLPAVQLLLERANRRLKPKAVDFRSPAGATMPMTDFSSRPAPDTPLAQEAARLVLPDLSGLSDRELLDLRKRLDQQEGMGEFRRELGRLLTKLEQAAWSADLQKEASDQARVLAERAAKLMQEAGAAESSDMGLSILVFPGLKREQVLGLMQSEQVEGLPGPEQWPNAWPQGSCTLLTVW